MSHLSLQGLLSGPLTTHGRLATCIEFARRPLPSLIYAASPQSKSYGVWFPSPSSILSCLNLITTLHFDQLFKPKVLEFIIHFYS